MFDKHYVGFIEKDATGKSDHSFCNVTKHCDMRDTPPRRQDVVLRLTIFCAADCQVSVCCNMCLMSFDVIWRLKLFAYSSSMCICPPPGAQVRLVIEGVPVLTFN